MRMLTDGVVPAQKLLPEVTAAAASKITFSCIIPTCGRSQLYHTLKSIMVQQYVKGDEVIVTCDGDEAFREAVKHVGRVGAEHPEGALYIKVIHRDKWRPEGFPKSKRYFAPRNEAIAIAKGSHIIFIDDDDEYAPGAWRLMREKVALRPHNLNAFQMYNTVTKRLIGEGDQIDRQNFGTPMGVMPRGERMPKWKPKDHDDVDFWKQVKQYCEFSFPEIRTKVGAQYFDTTLILHPILTVLLRKHGSDPKGAYQT